MTKTKRLSTILLGAILALGVGAGLAPRVAVKSEAATTYTKLTDVSTITSSKRYVLGIDGTFHYSGTSNWGLTSATESPYEYELAVVDASAKTFTAKTKVSNKDYYLTVPTSNTFTMSESSTTLKLGSNTHSSDAGTIKNQTTDARHIRRNGTSGLRSYAGTTGDVAFFYEIIGGEKDPATSVNVTTAVGVTTVKTGKSLQLSATVNPSGADQTVNWSSSNSLVATVNATTGIVTGVSEGNVTITATSTTPGISGTILINVEINTDTSESIVLANIGEGTTDSDSIKTTTVNGYVLNYKNGKVQTNSSEKAMLLTYGKGAFVGNKTPIPGSIESITIKTGIGASGSAKYDVEFGTTEFLTEGSGAASVTVGAGSSKTFENSSVSSATYFVVSVIGSEKNGQVADITIEYAIAPTKALTSIAVTTQPTKTTYYAGDIFDGTGMVVKAYYDDESNGVITPVLPTAPLVAGQTSVEISYTFGGTTKTTTVPITVLANPVTSLVWSNPVTTFTEGATLTLGAGVITATYANSNTASLTLNDVIIFVYSGTFDA